MVCKNIVFKQFCWNFSVLGKLVDWVILDDANIIHQTCFGLNRFQKRGGVKSAGKTWLEKFLDFYQPREG